MSEILLIHKKSKIRVQSTINYGVFALLQGCCER